MSEVVVAFPARPRRRTMAEAALAASRANRTATREISDINARRDDTRARFDTALSVYRAVFGTEGMLKRLEEAIALEQRLHHMDPVTGDG